MTVEDVEATLRADSPPPRRRPALPAADERAVLPAGFVAGATVAGIKPSGRPDLAVVAAVRDAVPAAAVFTLNRLAAAPVRLSRAHLGETGRSHGRFGRAKAILATSGSANAATGTEGDADQSELAADLAAALDCTDAETLALSTGIIGTRLPVARVRESLADLVRGGLHSTDAGFEAVARAIMTTDSRPKWATARIELPDEAGLARTVTVSGIAKGVGMIHPRMATMLAIVLTDAAADPETLSGLLRPASARTWNQLTVDGDTSTNDTVFLLASGASRAASVDPGSPEAERLGLAVEAVARSLARQQAADGEGAATLITCLVTGGRDDAEARAVARSVVSSSLVKTAVHGRDPNWGRIAAAAANAHLADAAVLEAAGLNTAEADARSGSAVQLDPDRLRVTIGGTMVFAGRPLPFDRAAVRAAMDAPEVVIAVDVGLGDGFGEAFGCDLTEDYVIENAEYTT